MGKIKFTDEEIDLLKNTVDVYNKSKFEVLNEFNNTYKWNYEVKAKWYDSEKEYIKDLEKLENERIVARSIVHKLNCISSKDWGKSIKC